MPDDRHAQQGLLEREEGGLPGTALLRTREVIHLFIFCCCRVVGMIRKGKESMADGRLFAEG